MGYKKRNDESRNKTNVPMRLSVFSVHIPFGGIALSNDIGEFVLC